MLNDQLFTQYAQQIILVNNIEKDTALRFSEEFVILIEEKVTDEPFLQCQKVDDTLQIT